MKNLRILSLVGWILGSVLLGAFSTPVALIKIQKTDRAQWGLLQKLQIDIAQELETCFIARADREDVRILRKNRVRFSVLDRNIEGQDYFLVPASSIDQLAALRIQGRLKAVESGTLLCWTKEDAPAPVLPPDVARTALPATSILQYLKQPSPPLAVQEYREVKDDLIQLMVDTVSEDHLRSLIQGLQSFQTRYASTSNCEAAGDFIFQYFQALGLEPSYELFPFGDVYTSRNIIAEKRGLTNSGEILIICAHYDSTSDTPAILAPGADDNASGTAAVMEAARIMRAYAFDFTVRFIAFSAEEWGLYGSWAHAVRARSRGERIIGVINLDMIAHVDAAPEDLELFVNQDSEWLAERLGLSARTYTGLPVRKLVQASFVYSDHASFWRTGYPALLGIEDWPLHNPDNHQTTDTVDILSLDFCTNVTKTALGTLAELAQPVRIGYPRAPEELGAKTYSYGSLFNSVRTVHLSWTAGPDAVGYNIYRSTISHLNYQKLSSSPVQSTAYIDRVLGADQYYYYVVTALGQGGLESNPSGEVEIGPIKFITAQTENQGSSSQERRGTR